MNTFHDLDEGCHFITHQKEKNNTSYMQNYSNNGTKRTHSVSYIQNIWTMVLKEHIALATYKIFEQWY